MISLDMVENVAHSKKVTWYQVLFLIDQFFKPLTVEEMFIKINDLKLKSVHSF